MSDTPKPPDGYANWLDYQCSIGVGAFILHNGEYIPIDPEWAAAELAALREDRDSLLMAAEDALCEADSLRAERDAAKLRNECQLCWCDGKHVPASVCDGHYKQAIAAVNAQDDDAAALRAERDRLREALEIAREYVPAVFVAWHEAVQQELAK